MFALATNRAAPATGRAAFPASLALHAALLLVAFCVTPPELPPPAHRASMTLVSPPIRADAPAVLAPRHTRTPFLPPVLRQPIRKLLLPPTPALRIEAAPAPKLLLADAPVLPPVRVSPPAFDALEPKPAAPAVVHLPAAAGFETGVAAAAPAALYPARAAVGGFSDVPPAAATRAEVLGDRSGGFESLPTQTGASGPRPVRSPGNFDSAAVVPIASSRSPEPAAVRRHIPLEIVYKPRPKYTPEARRLGIQGEVVLEAWFGASGQIRVLRVVEGLGHGLDETAIEAAGAIRFHPAQQDGRVVDTVGLVRISFELAY